MKLPKLDSPRPSEINLAGYRVMNNEMILFLQIDGDQKLYTLNGLEALIRKTNDQQIYEYLVSVYKQMTGINPSTFVAEMMPGDIGGPMYKQTELSLTPMAQSQKVTSHDRHHTAERTLIP